MTRFEELVQQLEGADDERTIDILHALGDLGDPRAVPVLARLLDTTDSPWIKNAAAIGLRELGDKSVVPLLMKHIRDPTNINNRGTLIYALETLDAGPEIRELVKLMCEGNYEVMSMVLRVIEAFDGPILMDDKQEALKYLKNCLKQTEYEDWQEEMLSIAIELLEQ